MTLEQYITHAIRKYPLLYKDIDYQHSKEKLLDQLFFTNGNGLEWVNGALVGYEEAEITEVEELPEDYFDVPIMSTEEDEDSIFKEWRLEDGKEYKPHEICSKDALNIYPICEYARIMHLPDDIQDDWLQGAIDAYNLARRYYADPYRHARQTYIQEWILTRNFEAISKYLKKQNKYLDAVDITIRRLLHHAS